MHSATYSPEDNKLRLYPSSRLPRDLYDRVKAAGFIWAAQQELFVAPAWTPTREDLLLELCGEIGDEDTSLVDRAEERAERFEDYSDKREQDAHQARRAVAAIADGIPLDQPILVGHHSERHARKDAERIENGMRKAVKMWETAKYWTDRAAGAIRHAKYKELPAVRARRIKGIEADKRKEERSKADLEKSLALWSKDGLTLEQARLIANYSHLTVCHPEGKAYGWTAWDVLRPDGERYQECPAWTVQQVQDKAKKVYPPAIARAERWIAHYENRLAYERAMLAEAGGLVSDQVKPEKGGGCRCWVARGGEWLFIKKVNKVSVTVEDNWGNGGRNFTRTVPFDKLKAILSKADVDAKRAAGLLAETADGIGLYVKTEAPATPRPKAEERPEDAPFDAMADSLKAGVKVVSAPQLFPTPPDLAARVVELANIQPGQSVLEPSAGTGALIRAVQERLEEADIMAVEINRTLWEGISGMVHKSLCADFLECNGELGTFDRIIMNPPFVNGADIKHIEHARGKLNPGGRLVAICANGPRQQEKLKPLTSQWHDLPAGTIADQGTSVRAALLVIDAKEGALKLF
jgi:protein-L-isoaspartate O-methyltransferase